MDRKGRNNKEEIPGSKRSMYGCILTYSKGERLSFVFSPDGALISASAAPQCGRETHTHTRTHTRTQTHTHTGKGTDRHRLSCICPPLSTWSATVFVSLSVSLPACPSLHPDSYRNRSEDTQTQFANIYNNAPVGCLM